MGFKNEGWTRVYLLRHGEIESSRQGKYNGHSDVDLSPKGIKQFHDLACRLDKEPIRAVFSSDLIRSRMGAEIIGKKFGLDVQVRINLREKNFGQWEGLTPDEVSRKFPNEWEEWINNQVDSVPSGGESYRNVYDWVKEVFEEIIKTHHNQEVVVVSHGGVNRVLLAYALQLDLIHVFRIEQKYGALNIIAIIKLING